MDTTYQGSNGASAVYTLAVQPDGKVLIGGTFAGSNHLIRLSPRFARLNADGSTDNTFNPVTGFNSNTTVTLVQPDGKIIVSGQFTSYFGQPAGGIARLNADGSMDNAFATAIGTGLGGNSLARAYALALQPDGKILACGNFTIFNGDTVNGILRLNPDGSRDLSFNTGKGATDANGNNTGMNIPSLHLQADGKILVIGPFALFNGDTASRIVRLNPDGSRDVSFNAGGVGFSGSTSPQSITTDANGMIYFTISQQGNYNGTPLAQRRICRLFPDGRLDPTFIIGTVGGSGGGSLGPVVPLPDGSILAGSGFLATITQQTGAYESVAYTVRGPVKFLSDGTLDTTFTGTANAAGGYGINSLRGVQTLLRQPDGRIIIGGTFTTYNEETVNHIARLMPDGSLDPTFSSGTGLAGYGEVNSVWNMALYPDNRLVIAGNFGAYSETGRNHIARIHLGTMCSSDTGTDVRTSCDTAFTWIDGKVYTENNYTAVHTLFGGNASGCDSVIRLNLTFLKPATGTDVQNICGEPYFQWIDGRVYIADNNTATHTIVGGAANGCDSVVTLSLTLTPYINTNVTASGATLTAAQEGVTYQWINCSNRNSPISGATQRTFTAINNGSYAVIITERDCSDTSECVVISHLSVGSVNAENGLTLYPNPAEGSTTLVFDKEGTYSLTDLAGRTVIQPTPIDRERTTIDLSKLSSGVYFIKVTTTDSRSITQRIIKN